jgi:hypothetical protein
LIQAFTHALPKVELHYHLLGTVRRAGSPIDDTEIKTISFICEAAYLYFLGHVHRVKTD